MSLERLGDFAQARSGFDAALKEQKEGECLAKIGAVIQRLFPTTEPSHSWSAHFSPERRVYFQNAAEIAQWSTLHREAQLALFRQVCAHFGIEEGADHTFRAQEVTRLFHKDLLPLWTRLIQSLVLCDPGNPLPTAFAHFLITCAREAPGLSGTERASLEKTSIPAWQAACAPHLLPNPLAHGLSKVSGGRFQVEVEAILRTQADRVAMNRLLDDAFARVGSGRTTYPTCYPTGTLPLGQIGRTHVLLYPSTTFAAIQAWTPWIGTPLAVLNFANAERAGGGFLGFGRVQEETAVHEGTLFHQFLELYRLGWLTYHPEHQSLVGGPHTGHAVEGSYPFQLLYTEEARHHIEGRRPLLLPSRDGTPDPDHVRAHRCAILYQPGAREKLVDPVPYWDLTAALEDRSKQAISDDAYYTEAKKEEISQTIKAILRTAAAVRNRNPLLGALGCGAFRHNPTLIASLFEAALRDPEFENAFDHIIFAIPDPTSANFRAFREALKAK